MPPGGDDDDAEAGIQDGSSTAPPSTKPTITTIEPNNGSINGGDTVTITGTNFSATTSTNIVKFGTEIATVTNATTETLTVTVPVPSSRTTPTDGSVNVTVEVMDETSDSLPYRYGPVITSITPDYGVIYGGNSVVIAGNNFSTTASNNIVKFGTLDATVTIATATSLTVTVPVRTVATSLYNYDVDVNVTMSNYKSNDVTYTYNGPYILSISPSQGSLCGGNSVTITGKNFSTLSTIPNVVTFGTQNATNVSVNVDGTSLTATVPRSDFTILVNVTLSIIVDSNTIESNSNIEYRYYEPTIQSISPNIGPSSGSNSVTITGRGFSTASTIPNVVTFGTQNATNVNVNVDGTSLTVTVPSSSINSGSSTVNVTVTNGTVVSNSVTYTYYYTYISSITPNPFPRGVSTKFTVSGFNFDANSSYLLGFKSSTGIWYNVTTSTYNTNTAIFQNTLQNNSYIFAIVKDNRPVSNEYTINASS